MNYTDILTSKTHNPHHLNRYIKFIKYCLAKNRDIDKTVYTEKHHICPKAKDMFPEYKSFHEHPWNLVRLTAKQHFVAHHILALAYDFRSVLTAFSFMLNMGNGHIRLYESIRIRLSLAMKNDNPCSNPETAAKIIATRKKNMTLEKYLHMAFSKLGIDKITQEGKKKLSNLWIGVPRPKTETHIENNKIACQRYWFVTPNGVFRSPSEASRHEIATNVTISNRCLKRSDEIIKKSNGLVIPKEWVGKTWREVGYYTTPLLP